MTRSDEHLLGSAVSMMNAAKSLTRDIKEAKRMVYAKPVRGAIPRQCGVDLDGFILTTEPDAGEQPVLIIPLTDECVAHLYDRVVTALSGVPRKLDVASEVLAVIGIEKEPRTPARLFQEDEPMEGVA
jgi:hypothetical protein